MARILRFVHAADLHLDSPFKGLAPMPTQLREQIVQSGFEAWEALVTLAINVQADALLLCGDLHDSENRSLRSQWRLQQGLKRLAEDGVRVFIIYGNHDPLSDKQDWEWPEGVTVLGKDEPESHWLHNRRGHITGVVTGMSYASRAVYANLAASYPLQPERNVSREQATNEQSPQRVYRIGMLHGTVDGKQEHDPYAPCSKQELIEKGYDYWALGHIHKREVLHEAPWIVYPGNLQGRHLKEAAPKGVYVVDVDRDGSSEIKFHTLDNVRWHDERLSIDGVETRQELTDLLWTSMECMREESSKLHLIRVTLTGRSALHRELMSGSLCTELEEAWREAELQRMEQGEAVVWPVCFTADSRSIVNIADWRESEHFIGEVIRMCEHLALQEDELDHVLEEVLQPLLQQRKLLKWTEGLTSDEKRSLLEEALYLVVDMLEGEPS